MCKSFNFELDRLVCEIYMKSDRDSPDGARFISCDGTSDSPQQTSHHNHDPNGHHDPPEETCATAWHYFESKSANYLEVERLMEELANLTYVGVDEALTVFDEFKNFLPPIAGNTTVTVSDLELITTSVKVVIEMNPLAEADFFGLMNFLQTVVDLSSLLIQPSHVDKWIMARTSTVEAGSAGALNLAEELAKYSSLRYMQLPESTANLSLESDFFSYWMTPSSNVVKTGKEEGEETYRDEAQDYISFFTEEKELFEGEEKWLKVKIFLPNLALHSDSMLVNVRYKNLVESVPRRNDREFIGERSVESTKVNSAVITTSVYPRPNSSVFEDTPIRIIFYHLAALCSDDEEECRRDESERMVCVFWQPDSNKFQGGWWSSEGCKLIKTNTTHTTCECSHLSSFALLLQVADFDISDEEMYESHMKVLDIITNIGCSLSLVGVTLMCAAFAKLKFHTENMKIHFNLGIAVGLADAIFLVERVGQYSKGACIVITILLYYTNMTVLAWMLIEAIHLYSQVVVVFVSTRGWLKYYLLLGWGFPVILLLVSASGLHWKLATDDVCWLSSKDGSIWAFAGPAIIVLVINTLILMAVVRVIVNIQSSPINSSNNSKTFRNAVKGSVFLFPLLGTTWLFGFLAITESTIVFQYLFASINSMQGFFLFVFHCLCNTEVRDGARRMKWFKLNHDSSSFVKSRSTSSSSLSPWCYRKYAVSTSSSASNSGCNSKRKDSSNNEAADKQSWPASEQHQQQRHFPTNNTQTSWFRKFSKIMPHNSKRIFSCHNINVFSSSSTSSQGAVESESSNGGIKLHQLPGRSGPDANEKEAARYLRSNKSLAPHQSPSVTGSGDQKKDGKDNEGFVDENKKKKSSLPRINEEEEVKMSRSYDSGLNSIENESMLDEEDDETWMTSQAVKIVHRD